jgi:hypothetical protein
VIPERAGARAARPGGRLGRRFLSPLVVVRLAQEHALYIVAQAPPDMPEHAQIFKVRVFPKLIRLRTRAHRLPAPRQATYSGVPVYEMCVPGRVADAGVVD